MATLKLSEVVIRNVTEVTHGDKKVYSFAIPAEDYLRCGVVVRFAESQDEGIQRTLVEKHALEIAQFMSQPDADMPDNIVVHLESGSLATEGWRFNPKMRTLTGRVVEGNDLVKRRMGCYMNILDGQHRREACVMLSAKELARWNFSTVAYVGLSRDGLRKLFLQQFNRKPVEKSLRLSLAGFANEREQHAYELIQALNQSEDSPLKDGIYFGEKVGGKYPQDKIRVGSIIHAMREVVGTHSPLYRHSQEERARIVTDYLRACRDVWHQRWDRKDDVSGPIGIMTFIIVFVRGVHFNRLVKGEYTHARFVEVLRPGLGIKWAQDGERGGLVNPSMRAKNLDARLNV